MENIIPSKVFRSNRVFYDAFNQREIYDAQDGFRLIVDSNEIS